MTLLNVQENCAPTSTPEPEKEKIRYGWYHFTNSGIVGGEIYYFKVLKTSLILKEITSLMIMSLRMRR